MAVSTILFEDIFDVKDIDQDGKKFERGSLQLKIVMVTSLASCKTPLLSGVVHVPKQNR